MRISCKRRAKGGEGREQIERDLALREPHRQNGEGLDTQDLMEAKALLGELVV